MVLAYYVICLLYVSCVVLLFELLLLVLYLGFDFFYLLFVSFCRFSAFELCFVVSSLLGVTYY